MTASLPAVVLFDVNETLSDLSPMASRFGDVGAPEHLATTWFASLLRDGFALTAAGSTAAFAELGAGALRVLLAGVALDRPMDEAVEHIMRGFGGLPVHDDVPGGIRALAALGTRLITLSNGAATVALALFERAGIVEHFEQLLSVQDIGVWKPAPASYAYAVSQCGVAPEAIMLVAAHPWDIDGAARVGLRTAWVNRAGGPYPDHFLPPSIEVASIEHLAEVLAA